MTADHVAAAIWAACRITGAEHDKLLAGQLDPGGPHTPKPYHRARRLCAAALATAFPEIPRSTIARLIGVQGNDRQQNFVGDTFKYINKGAFAVWWSDAALEYVSRAVAARGQVQQPAEGPAPPQGTAPAGPEPAPAPEDRPRGAALPDALLDQTEPRSGRPIGATLAARRVAAEGSLTAHEQQSLGRRADERRRAYDLLAEAAANTARMQAKD